MAVVIQKSLGTVKGGGQKEERINVIVAKVTEISRTDDSVKVRGSENDKEGVASIGPYGTLV